MSPRLKVRQSQWQTASRDRGFSFDDKPTVDSKDELTIATSRSHNLRRRSNCNLCTCSFPPSATRSPGRGRACPTLPGSAAMYAQGTASRPPTAKGLSGIGVRPGSAGARGSAPSLRSGQAQQLFQRRGFLPRRKQGNPNCYEPRRGGRTARLESEPCATHSSESSHLNSIVLRLTRG